MTSTPGCSVVMYHYVRDAAGSRFPRLKALPVADFVAQLDWMQRNYEIIDHERLLAALDGRETLPSTSALLTFDDGFIDHYEIVYPELRARNVTGLFFVSGSTLDGVPELLNVHKTHFLIEMLGADRFMEEVRREIEDLTGRMETRAQWPGIYRLDAPADQAAKRLLNYELPFDTADSVLESLFRCHLGDPGAFARALYLSTDMIAEMVTAGMTFGFHTRRHRVLSRLSRAEQKLELCGGVESIRAMTGQRSAPFCYPYGKTHTYNADTLQILAEEGYSMAFNTVHRGLMAGREARYELPRLDTRDLPVTAEAGS